MLRGKVYHCPATEFQRISYLVGAKSGTMEEWAEDVALTNAKHAKFAHVELTDAPIRARIDGQWEDVWLHNHVVRTTGCLPIPKQILVYSYELVFDVLFKYKKTTLLLAQLSMADVTRVRHWFHREIEISPTPVVP